jgi:hypothetical protein
VPHNRRLGGVLEVAHLALELHHLVFLRDAPHAVSSALGCPRNGDREKAGTQKRRGGGQGADLGGDSFVFGLGDLGHLAAQVLDVADELGDALAPCLLLGLHMLPHTLPPTRIRPHHT